jgi:hypothetical protein
MTTRGWPALAAALCMGITAAAAADDKLPLDGSVDSKTLAARYLSSVYDAYDKQRGCWIAKDKDPDPGPDFCMKLDRVDLISSNSGKRLYILAAGDVVDPNTAGHPSPGLIGAFVLEDHNGRTETIAAGSDLAIAGNFGMAPKKWKFVQLGPSDYWGWENTDDYANQGYSGSYYVILAPFGKSVRDLAGHGLRAAQDDSGACPEDSKTCNDISWTSTLEPDSSSGDSVYPLVLTVSGTRQGKDIRKTFHIPFERKTWSYRQPDDPLFTEE